MKIFISTVSSQFKACRNALRGDLSAVGAEVVVQEDFQQHGFSLLEKLETYITSCDRVVALVGDGYGYEPEESARPAGRPRRSYTQWEYYFALGERLDGSTAAPKPLYVYFAEPEFIAALGTTGNVDPEGLQDAFIAQVRASGKDWSAFKSLDELRAVVLRDGFRLESVSPQLRNPSQRVVMQGNHNIAVQIVGDGNSVNVSYSHLSLLRYGAFPVRDTVGLLYAQARAIPVIGREDTLDSLGAWAGSDAPISVRVIVGGGGSGKTRLAMELCDRLAGTGWDAGFLTASELSRFRAQQNLGTWGWRRPTLVVVDYAAARADLLNAWFSELANNPGTPGVPLRILLLERHADPGSGWWQAAFGTGGASTYAIQGLLDPPEPVKLLPLAPPQRRQILDAMLAKLGSDERVPAEGTDAQFDQRLANLTWGGDPLYLLIAASRAAQTGLGDLLALNRVELVSAVARDEITRLRKHAQASGLSDAVLCHMAAFVTLCGGLGWEALADAIPAELQALRRPKGGDPADITNALREALPGNEGSIAPILPDAVGEGFVLAVLDANSTASGVVTRAWQLAHLAVGDTLIRCAQDFGQAEVKPPLTWLQTLVDEADDIGTLIAVAQRVPESTVILRSFAARLSRRIVDGLKQDDPTPDALRPDLAGSLHNLANRLSDLGDREGALGAAQEAVEIRRALAAKNPDAFRPDLAGSLHSLANRLGDLGDREGALGMAQEAVESYRALAAKNPDAFRPALAGSLTNLANRLGDLGDREGALGPALEAVESYRALAAKSPDAFRPDLAGSLNNLANRLSALGGREGALGPALEAVESYRALAAKNPDAFRPDLAASLNNLAGFLSDLGAREGALGPAQEAVEIRRALAAKSPDAFRPALAGSLHNLASRLSELGDREGALEAAQEAVESYRALAAKNPDAFRPALAASLNNLASFLSDLGGREGALGAAQEAVESYRALAAKNPDAFRSALAGSLTNLASHLSDLGEREGALGPALEAVESYRALAAKSPDAFRPDLAASLNNLANRLSDLGEREGALGPALEAVEIRRALAAKNPDAFRPHLAVSLHNLASRLSQLGDWEGALGAAHEAIDALARSFLSNPRAFAAWMATMAQSYLKRCQDCDSEPDMALLDPISLAFEKLQGQAQGDEV